MANFTVTPWEVKGQVDYEELVKRFGTAHISPQQHEQIAKLAGRDHFLLKRKIFFSQRDLAPFLSEFEKGRKVALYTGRGPSGHTHIGHLMPWVFTKYLQDAFNCTLYFQMTDDEKFLFKDGLTREQARSFALENALDLIALGVKQSKTRIIIDTDDIKELYGPALEVAKRLTFSTAKSVFGFSNETNVGRIFFTTVQSAPAFLPSIIEREGMGDKKVRVPVLIPCAIDQDPHFRVTRDVAEKIGFPKPSLIHARFLPSLSGGDKMSASAESSAIYTTDDEETVEKKVGRAFTGGRPTVKEQREKGGNPDVCSVCAYLKYFFEPDEKKLQDRLHAYRNGDILDGENKAYLTKKINAFLKEHQRKREKAREVVDRYLFSR
ncbi:MAG: tryptophan--tRNA ligase [Candidatus Micrarchaeia archaeon]